MDNPFAVEMAAYATSDDADEEWGEVHIDGVPVPVRGQVGVVNLATLPQRLTFGDYTLSSDNFLSVWVQSDWTGGGQVEDLREASHAERFRHASAETRFPRMLSQPPETTSSTITNATEAAGIGDYAVAGVTSYWAAFDDGTPRLRKWNTSSLLWDGGADLSAMPAGKGVVYDDLLWIPQGPSGYQTWNGAAVVAGAAGISAVSFVEWDDKLVALEDNGQVSTWDGFSWTSEAALRLRGNRTPRHLVVWWTADRFPAVYVITDRDVWAVDFLVPTLYRTGLKFPAHPDQGLGSDVWRDDSLYVSVGVGAHQLGLGMVISPAGLDRDDGMPVEFRGKIVDMEGEYNGLYALVEGTASTVVTPVEVPVIEETAIRDDAMIADNAATFARSTLQDWTGIGWHTAWESDGAAGVPTRVQVSQAGGEYFVAWGYAGSMYRQNLRRTFHNPRQGALATIDRFASLSQLETGRFDANLATFHKLASHLEFHLDPASTGEVDVYYSTDHFDGFHFLGTVSGTGQQFVVFDPDGDGFAEGDAFHWIEFRYVLRNTSAIETVIVNWISLYFVVRPLQSTSYRGVSGLDAGDERHQGEGFAELAAFLDGLTVAEHFSTFKHRDRMRRVLVAQTNGTDNTGKDLRGGRTWTVIEVPSGQAVGE